MSRTDTDTDTESPTSKVLTFEDMDTDINMLSVCDGGVWLFFSTATYLPDADAFSLRKSSEQFDRPSTTVSECVLSDESIEKLHNAPSN
jgi:hypothetical protein